MGFYLPRSYKSACHQEFLEKLNSVLKAKYRSNMLGAKYSDAIETATDSYTPISIWLF